MRDSNTVQATLTNIRAAASSKVTAHIDYLGEYFIIVFLIRLRDLRLSLIVALGSQVILRSSCYYPHVTSQRPLPFLFFLLQIYVKTLLTTYVLLPVHDYYFQQMSRPMSTIFNTNLTCTYGLNCYPLSHLTAQTLLRPSLRAWTSYRSLWSTFTTLKSPLNLSSNFLLVPVAISLVICTSTVSIRFSSAMVIPFLLSSLFFRYVFFDTLSEASKIERGGGSVGMQRIQQRCFSH